MTRRPSRLVVALFLFGAVGPEASAHPLAPALLEIREIAATTPALDPHVAGSNASPAPGATAAVRWRTPLRVAREAERAPQLPDACHAVGASDHEITPSFQERRFRVACRTGLVGRTIGVSGLAETGTNALVRLELADGRRVARVLHGDAPSFVVPERDAPAAIALGYAHLGIRHLATGFDHLCFLAGLVFLVRGWRRLAGTVTAFTAGHSITLALAVLGWIRLPSAPIELGIAASLLWLALEMARGPGAFSGFRRPWLMAGGFGLLHGLGFAGALREIGLPPGDVPLALLSFNLGIEIGQLAAIGSLGLAGAACTALAATPPPWLRSVASHAIGALAVYWCIERIETWIG